MKQESDSHILETEIRLSLNVENTRHVSDNVEKMKQYQHDQL